ncbi:MAG TPA: hypothetical protein DEA78_26260, partial [Cyanobacteria bacterium UBA11159]|nr:hypothetical protein [Cyanobacteria bacterium UBA11159]
ALQHFLIESLSQEIDITSGMWGNYHEKSQGKTSSSELRCIEFLIWERYIYESETGLPKPCDIN